MLKMLLRVISKVVIYFTYKHCCERALQVLCMLSQLPISVVILSNVFV